MRINEDFAENTLASKHDPVNVEPLITLRQLYFIVDNILDIIQNVESRYGDLLTPAVVITDILSKEISDTIAETIQSIHDEHSTTLGELPADSSIFDN